MKKQEYTPELKQLYVTVRGSYEEISKIRFLTLFLIYIQSRWMNNQIYIIKHRKSAFLHLSNWII